MAVAFILAAIVLASLVFHAVSPWRATPLASNWSAMDETYFITLAATGLFFVVLNGFVVFAVARYRHTEGRRAAYLPNDHRLERRLIVATALGIVVLLAPGLFVYASYVRAPSDAIVIEALAQQWQWRFRLPGPDGKLAKTDIRFVSATNPFGVDPGDPAAPGNVLVSGGELHLPVNKPVRMLLRSNDVLHDFYVPQFRGRMNIVPGMVTTFWFTPTTAGRYEILCAQLCGIGHFNMRGHVVVEDEAAFETWRKGQPVFATASAAGG
ncbi:cytochrome c oxidase subunit II, partial [Oxalobacteraceae bacterium OM1]